MKALEDRIMDEGRVLPGNIILLDSFLNHGIDASLMNQMAESWVAYFKDEGITKVMTLEASGIAIAVLVALQMGVPALFAKKHQTLNMTADRHQARVFSYTKNQEYTIAVSRRLLSAEDRVLLIDDFLANGCAMLGLIELVQSAGAEVAGIGIAVEKTFQAGRSLLAATGHRVCSLAKIDSLDQGIIHLAAADA